jgi:hypothetical protein
MRGVVLSVVAAALVLCALGATAVARESGSAGGARTEAAGVAAVTPSKRGLTTAMYSLGAPAAELETALDHVQATGARMLRIHVYWSAVAPRSYPTGPFRASDPGDPHYDWGALDREVSAAVRRGLQPILSISAAPRWGSVRHHGLAVSAAAPALDDYTAFATALATRYSGRYRGLPRVRYWMAWNEPNAIYYWAPQLGRGKTGKLVAPAYYRTVLAAFSRVVHRADPRNRVVAGSLTPFSRPSPQSIAPLRWMRELLCMSDGPNPRRTCSNRAVFDIWAHHPYTSGGPAHEAAKPDDVSVGDLPEMKRLLDAAVRAGRVVSRGPVEFWVTEFSWDTDPPDRNGVPAGLHARWVSEALYRMWSAGVNVVTWLQLRDSPYPADDYQSGLYYRGPSVAGDRQKPAFRSYRFPFVAFADGRRLAYWGRTPTSSPGRVVIERAEGAGWRAVAAGRADRFGIFRGSFATTIRSGSFRARVGSDTSTPFSLTKPRDLLVSPFGTTPRRYAPQAGG